MTDQTHAGVFVRGLWGEAQDAKHPTSGHGRALQAAKRSCRAPHQPEPQVVYVWGNENFAALERFRLNLVLVSPDPLTNYGTTDVARDCTSRGQVNWGVSMWRHKLEAIRMALDHHPAIVWLDWDTHQVANLPPDFWQRLAAGQPFQGSLRQYKRKQCLWRPEKDNPRLVPHGAWIYCREQRLVERAIELHAERVPTFTDETAWAAVLDELLGGWKGRDEYHRRGFEPYCYLQGQNNWRQFFKPTEVIFENTGRC